MGGGGVAGGRVAGGGVAGRGGGVAGCWTGRPSEENRKVIYHVYCHMPIFVYIDTVGLTAVVICWRNDSPDKDYIQTCQDTIVVDI